MFIGRSCLLSVFLACLLCNTSSQQDEISVTSVFNGHRDTVQEEGVRPDVRQEGAGDDASLLQLTLSSHAEHPLQEHKQAKLMNASKYAKKVSPIEAPLASKSKLIGRKEANQYSLLRTFMAAHLRKPGDKELGILGAIFLGVVLCGGFFAICCGASSSTPRKYASSSAPPPTARSTGSLESSMMPSSRPQQKGLEPAPSSQPPSGRSAGSLRASESKEPPILSVLSGSQKGHLPLCPHYVVPPKTRMNCIVPAIMRRKKQDLSFAIKSNQGIPIFKVVVDEQDPGVDPSILLKSPDDFSTVYARLDTKKLFTDPEHATITMYQGLDHPFCTVEKNKFNGGFELMRFKRPLMNLYGDFANNSGDVTSTNGYRIAIFKPLNEGEYLVQVQENQDASLILLSLLAANKFDNTHPDLGVWLGTA